MRGGYRGCLRLVGVRSPTMMEGYQSLADARASDTLSQKPDGDRRPIGVY